MASFENSFLEFVYYTYKSLKKKISSKFFLTTIMYENRGDICNSIVTRGSFSIDSRFERAPRGGSAHFSIQRCMLLDSSTRSLRYLHKSWCNCRERWLAGITEIRNDEAREDWNAGERNWVMLGSWPLPVSTFFHVYSQGDGKNNCSLPRREYGSSIVEIAFRVRWSF